MLFAYAFGKVTDDPKALFYEANPVRVSNKKRSQNCVFRNIDSDFFVSALVGIVVDLPADLWYN